jgi:hypothetical protein
MDRGATPEATSLRRKNGGRAGKRRKARGGGAALFAVERTEPMIRLEQAQQPEIRFKKGARGANAGHQPVLTPGAPTPSLRSPIRRARRE